MRIGTMGRITSSSATTERLAVVAASQMIGLATAPAAAAGTAAPATFCAAGGVGWTIGRNGSDCGFNAGRAGIFLSWRRVACVLLQLGISHLGRCVQDFAVCPPWKQWKHNPFADRRWTRSSTLTLARTLQNRVSWMPLQTPQTQVGCCFGGDVANRCA